MDENNASAFGSDLFGTGAKLVRISLTLRDLADLL